MNGADVSGLTTTVPSGNGKHRTPAKNGALSKRSRGVAPRPGTLPAPEPSAAPFATIESGPINAPMWPVHTVVWFQPERTPAIPAWSGLAIERLSRIPAPDFLHAEPATCNRPERLSNSCEAIAPNARPDLPQSDLAPLGWDARAVCRNGKEGG